MCLGAGCLSGSGVPRFYSPVPSRVLSSTTAAASHHLPLPAESSDSSPTADTCEPHVATVQHAGTTFYVSGEFIAGDIRVLVNMLLDTGASVTLVHRRLVSKLGLMHEMYPATRLGVTGLLSAGGDQVGFLFAVDLTFELSVSKFVAPAFVVDGLRESCLLGADVLSAQELSICLVREMCAHYCLGVRCL